MIHPQGPKILCRGMFSIQRLLGEGRFGKVYLARETSTGFICALKVLSKQALHMAKAEKRVFYEVECQRNPRHPSTLRLYGHFHDSQNVYLVLEYTCGGDLYDHMQSSGPFKEDECARFMAQMAFAVDYLHRKRVIHRDIKPENILIGLHGEIKIADFGCSVTGTGRNTICGTAEYLAPEMITVHMEGGHYDEEVDIWSLGILMFELLVGLGKAPQLNVDRTWRVDSVTPCDVHLAIPPFLSPEARDLMGRLLVIEPIERISLRAIQSHPWILKHCLEKLR
ncbi:kinase-like domain-containing protein [Colletotrichum godetiae]|uniref:Aurora kinase n=1 Tax=Colletotrichum godetiae TaxID=1209918 RepID=A0AAJ0A7U0_9PEZI|nr:kinase-like domain-containing protein [Colletotrichum godetiae]KAK1658092.1 kinase-like domain-containing protein [Colletotrichum godetiae]